MSEPKTSTLVMSRAIGEKFILQIDGITLLDLLIVAISNKKVELAFRVADNVKISTIKKLMDGKIGYRKQ